MPNRSSMRTSSKSPVQLSGSSPSAQQPGFFSNMLQGFGLGAGQSIAMNIFRSDPKVTHIHENANTSNNVSSLEMNLPKEFVQCMKENNNKKDLCKEYLE